MGDTDRVQGDAPDRWSRLIEENQRLRRLLDKVIWSPDKHNEMDDTCRICGCPRYIGHAPDCEMNELGEKLNDG